MEAPEPPPPRSLDVWIDRRKVGQLRERGNIWAFRYTPEWQAQGFDLSPALPRADGEIIDGASLRPVQWFFDNLLPEEGSRQLMAQSAGVDPADAFGLLQHYGPESAGALVLLPGGSGLPGPGLQPLPDEELSARIRALPRAPLAARSPKRMSLAGARHKLPVVLHQDRLWEPVGAAASTHILKPDHERTDLYPHSAANEWFCMRLAAACGLPVPQVSLRRVPEPVFLVRRFDREGEGLDVRRLYALDACQALSLDPVFKYREATAARLVELVALCRRPAATRLALFRWQLFNLLIGNGDAHLKNLSLLPDPGGHGLDLAPHYDLLSTAVYRAPDWADAGLVIPMGTARTFGSVRRDDVVAFAAAIGVPESAAQREAGQMIEAVRSHGHALAQACSEGADGPVDAGEAWLLRQIVHGVVEDAVRALQV
ncbi:MAG: HipA domain-containing protein [Xanthomonadales bacterium]|nr:HipA domain-containing protein [Xanthomonadales bacterium]